MGKNESTMLKGALMLKFGIKLLWSFGEPARGARLSRLEVQLIDVSQVNHRSELFTAPAPAGKTYGFDEEQSVFFIHSHAAT